ncbi:unnamed protein product [Gongylonema pulchrum]|uniref:Uncharacterized protein n=1 Tax=Gongylonema pulchrum TaxID=637853 RepID=A0A3P7N6D1_9BILA|nr:unnamed protein product [Gongylonema pulchrum]
MFFSRLKSAAADESNKCSDVKCWKETGIRLLSTSECRIYDGENTKMEEGPPKKRKKKNIDKSCSDSMDERAKIRASVVDVDFIKQFQSSK